MHREAITLLIGALLATQSGCVFDFVLDRGDGGVIYVDRECWDCTDGYYDEVVYTPDDYRDVWVEEEAWVDEVWFEEYPTGDWDEEWYDDELYYEDGGYDPLFDEYYDEEWYEE
ncbi:MAG: hypothetical protein AB1601_11825 [Planctomycetota bacterium]